MNTKRFFLVLLTHLFGVTLLALAPQAAFAADLGTCTPTTCSAPAPTCSQRRTFGTDNCGNSCSKTFSNACSAPAPTCDQRTTTGTWTCGGTCTKGPLTITCSAATPACGQTTTGTWTCGGTCTKNGPSCSSTWLPYGFSVPGDPQYGFGLADNNTKNSLGLAAKGNIVIGDYTNPQFATRVVPLLKPGLRSVTQPYVVDPTDIALGYRDYDDSQGRPVFLGNYDRQDGGRKLDNSTRKFYESTLADSTFRSLVDSKLMNPSASVRIDGILFTNHALAGLVTARDLTINGTLVARDDGLIVGRNLSINHDMRLTNTQIPGLGLPVSIARPRLVTWQECPPAGCP